MSQIPNPTRSWRPADLVNALASAVRLLFDRRVPFGLKLVLPVAAMVYWVWPIDLLPGLPFDDIAVLALALTLFVNLAERAISAPRQSSANTQQTDERDRSHDDVVDTTWRVLD